MKLLMFRHDGEARLGVLREGSADEVIDCHCRMPESVWSVQVAPLSAEV